MGKSNYNTQNYMHSTGQLPQTKVKSRSSGVYGFGSFAQTGSAAKTSQIIGSLVDISDEYSPNKTQMELSARKSDKQSMKVNTKLSRKIINKYKKYRNDNIDRS